MSIIDARPGIPFDLRLPSGMMAELRMTKASQLALDRECGDSPIMAMLGRGQLNSSVLLLMWAGRLHEERWTLERASRMLERYLHAVAGKPPEYPVDGDPAARKAYRVKMREHQKAADKALLDLAMPLGEMMVIAGEWRINVFDQEAMKEDAAARDSDLDGESETDPAIEEVPRSDPEDADRPPATD